MRTAVRKWGNSLAVRLPKGIAEDSGLEAGTEIEIAIHRGHVVLRPVKPAPTLDEMLSGVTDDNLHDEVQTGSRVGREVW